MTEEDKLKTNNEKVTINDYYYYYLLKCEDALDKLEKWLKFFNKNGLVIDLEEGKQTTVMPTLAVIEKLQELKGENNE